MESPETISHYPPGRLKTLQRVLRPGPAFWRGATIGIAVAVTGVFLAEGLGLADGDWALISVVAITGLSLIFGFLSGALADLILGWLVKFYAWTPPSFRIVLLGGVIFLALSTFRNLPILGIAVPIAVIVVGAGLAGAGLLTYRRSRRQAGEERTGGYLSLTAFVVGLAGLGAAVWWYLWPGPDVIPAPVLPPARAASAYPAMEDPTRTGPYGVLRATYGSGDDRRRVEFGSEANWTTSRVDGSPFVWNWQGLSGWLRSQYWGFDDTQLPLNGRVWYPDGEGPFPIVLIVHGNHSMMDYSDAGYEYLGELLASRGVIFVSVDQNFLNGSWVDIGLMGVEGLTGENVARGWLLLEHLRAWQQWHWDIEHALHGKVDLGRVALMGHSRGGEAAAIGAAFNRLDYYPEDATISFDYNFGIRGVVAIAPGDSRYMPQGGNLFLEDINYLTFHGAYDGDVTAFRGIRQYNRVTFTGAGNWFKAALYIDQANHGQFNSAWGRVDNAGFPQQGLLNLAPIMNEADQQQIARILVSAFVEATLHENEAYKSLFKYPEVMREWGPHGVSIGRYQDSRTQILADFSEDLDVTTASVAGVRIVGHDLRLWTEQPLPLKWDVQGANAVQVGWALVEAEAPPWYSLAWEEGAVSVENATHLVFDLAREIPPVEPSMADSAAGRGYMYNYPLDLTVELRDAGGNVSAVVLSEFDTIPPRIRFPTWKASIFERTDSRDHEPMLKTFALPLEAFQVENPSFDADELVEIRFVFDRSAVGVVLMDQIGVRH